MRARLFSTLLMSSLTGVFSCTGQAAQFVDHASDEGVIIFRGMSDASTAIALDGRRLLVADDEINVLRLYHLDDPLAAPLELDLGTLPGFAQNAKEADLEGAARVGDRIYLIASNGRDKKGELAPGRHRFFAITLEETEGTLRVRQDGRMITSLPMALATSPRLRELDLATTLKLHDNKDKDLAPKDQGFNIEGLAASPDGSTLWIGLRNPRPERNGRPQAVVIPIHNPEQVIASGTTPEFGDPLLWDFGGLGIRSMEYDPRRACYWIIAGPHDSDNRPLALYRWDGDPAAKPTFINGLDALPDGFTPEALVCFPDDPRLLLLSDDGSRLIRIGDGDAVDPSHIEPDGTAEQKRLLDPMQRTFRGFWIELPQE